VQWTFLGGVQAIIIFKAERRPATSWANAAWTVIDSQKISKIDAIRCQTLM